MEETIELFREILPLLKDAGDAAFWLLLLAVLKGYFTPLITFLFLGLVSAFAYKVFVRLNMGLKDRLYYGTNLYRDNALWLAEQLQSRNAEEWVNELRARKDA